MRGNQCLDRTSGALERHNRSNGRLAVKGRQFEPLAVEVVTEIIIRDRIREVGNEQVRVRLRLLGRIVGSAGLRAVVVARREEHCLGRRVLCRTGIPLGLAGAAFDVARKVFEAQQAPIVRAAVQQSYDSSRIVQVLELRHNVLLLAVLAFQRVDVPVHLQQNPQRVKACGFRHARYNHDGRLASGRAYRRSTIRRAHDGRSAVRTTATAATEARRVVLVVVVEAVMVVMVKAVMVMAVVVVTVAVVVVVVRGVAVRSRRWGIARRLRGRFERKGHAAAVGINLLVIQFTHRTLRTVGIGEPHRGESHLARRSAVNLHRVCHSRKDLLQDFTVDRIAAVLYVHLHIVRDATATASVAATVRGKRGLAVMVVVTVVMTRLMVVVMMMTAVVVVAVAVVMVVVVVRRGGAGRIRTAIASPIRCRWRRGATNHKALRVVVVVVVMLVVTVMRLHVCCAKKRTLLAIVC